MSRCLWDAFAADRVDHRELQQLIARRFPSGSQAGRHEIVYPGDGEYAIKLVFTEHDRLRAIEPGPSLTPALEHSIATTITDALLTTAEHRIIRRVLFAHHKLAGYWRYKDQFQVLPVPPSTPQINAVFGDHPFVLEVLVPASPDSSITQMRADRLLRDTELLLAGLVNSSIRALTRRGFYGRWVLVPGADRACAYLQDYFDATDLPKENAFSPPGIPAPIISPYDLFGPNGLFAGQPLSFPAGLPELLELVEGLPRRRREQLLRACYWVQLANRLLLESFSAAYLAIVTAAEVLFPEASPERCPTCKQHQYRLRHRFATFLEQHVPLAPLTSAGYRDVPSFLARLRLLYDARSGITHGSELRGWDRPTSGFTPGRNEDDGDLRTLVRILQFALGAWLVQQCSGRT